MNLVTLANPAKALGVLFVQLSLLVCSLQAVHDCGWTLISLLHRQRAVKHFRLGLAFKSRTLLDKCFQRDAAVMGLFTCLPFKYKVFSPRKSLNEFVFKCGMLCKLAGFCSV